MLVNRLKFLSIAPIVFAVATTSLAQETVTHATINESGRAAWPVEEVPELPKSEPHFWEFAGVPRKGPAILVNIPSFELIAFRDGDPVLRSKVIIGTRRNQTPVIRTETSVVRFRPTWTPTPTMIREGTRPGMRRPGRRNPLGLLAVRLEPGMLVYLHGTNKPHLFKRDNRSLSHGCVRVEKWDQVAAFVLNTTINEVHKHANGRRTFDKGTNNVPVILGYHTKFPDADGNWQDYRDIYGRNGRKNGATVARKRGGKKSAKRRSSARSKAAAAKRANTTAAVTNIRPASVRSNLRSSAPDERAFNLQR